MWEAVFYMLGIQQRSKCTKNSVVIEQHSSRRKHSKTKKNKAMMALVLEDVVCYGEK